MFRKLRILILLYILLMVAGIGWLTKERTTDWNTPLTITIYPINGDNSENTVKYIKSLDSETFRPIEDFFGNEAGRYKIALKQPVDIDLAPQIRELPPKPPFGGSTLSVMYWSLKLRYWAWSRDNYKYPKQIQVFVVYFDPEKQNKVAHSLGLQKGLIGVVNVFADKKMDDENNVVITHEILHTLGASDKYDPHTNLPLYPVGYAEPDNDPLLPQKKAEIMAGRIAVEKNKAEIPKGLKETVVGTATAMEIRWLTGRK